MPVCQVRILLYAGKVKPNLLLEFDTDIVAHKRHVTLRRADERSRQWPITSLDVFTQLPSSVARAAGAFVVGSEGSKPSGACFPFFIGRQASLSLLARSQGKLDCHWLLNCFFRLSLRPVVFSSVLS